MMMHYLLQDWDVCDRRRKPQVNCGEHIKPPIPHLDVYFRMSLVQSRELLEVGAVCIWLKWWGRVSV